MISLNLFFSLRKQINVSFISSAQHTNCDVQVGSNCYRLFTSAVTWAEANTACQATGGTLASVMTQQEQDSMKQAAQRQNLDGVWLGGQEVKTDWHWTGEQWTEIRTTRVMEG